MPQVPEATYKSEGTFNNALYFLVKNGWLQEDETALLSSMNPEYKALIVNVPQLMNVDFLKLFLPRLDYAEQQAISRRQARIMDVLAVNYNGNFGIVMRALGGEVTAEWRNVKQVLLACEPHSTREDLKHIRRALTRGCPAEFNLEEPAANKESFIRRGNAPDVTMDSPHVMKTLNKEERNSHVMCFSR